MAQKEFGHQVWFFPDGDLPPAGDGLYKGHEALMILNPNDRNAEVTLTVYFEDRDPASPPAQTVKGRRVRCVRLDQPIGSLQIPIGQYAIKVQSTVPVICQIGRADVRQPNLAYYTVMGFPS
jgi:hypothetical protein